jgi:hypothetical protein
MTFPIFDLGNISYLTAIKFGFVSCNKTLLGRRIVLWFGSYFDEGSSVPRLRRRNAKTSRAMAAGSPIADPAAIPTMAPVLRPFAAAAVEVGGAAKTTALLEVEVAIVEVELPETVVEDCADMRLVERVELLVEDVVVPGTTINLGEGIFRDPT